MQTKSQGMCDHFGRIPPQNLDFEEAILGAMMLEKNAVELVIDRLRTEMFYKESHQHIFDAIKMVFESKNPIDLISITHQLRKNKTLEAVGGAYYLGTLTNRIISSANIEYHVRILTELFLKRNLISQCVEVIKEAYDDSSDALELSSRAKKAMDITNYITFKTNALRFDECLIDITNHIRMNSKKKHDHIELPTGFHEFDRKSRGLHGSDLVIVAARTSHGKTSFMLSVLSNLAKKGIPVMIYSMEMSALQQTARLVSAECEDVSASEILYAKLEDQSVSKIIDVLGKISELPIHTDQSSINDIDQVLLDIRRQVKEHKIRVVAVDYAQLIQKKGNENTEQKTAYIARSLKNLAKELNICVILLSQLNRSSKGKPTLRDLRDSGQLEEAADMAILIWRPELESCNFCSPFEECSTNGTAHINVAKGRNTGVFEFLLGFNANNTSFFNLTTIEKKGVETYKIPY